MNDIKELPYKAGSLRLIECLDKKIVVLDGAMGTMIQSYRLGEDDFRSTQFADWSCQLKGCNDLLTITRPDVIEEIHTKYLNAGARIIETDSFNSNAVSLADYALSDYASEINRAAAKVARCAADKWMSANPGEECWVAGSIGPTSKSLSMSQGLDADSENRVNWDVLADAYFDQCKALIEGGVDLLQIETVFDGLNAKAALWSARRAMEALGVRIPIIVSVTLTESGRTLSGQTLEAFIATIAHAEPLAIGLNCGFGADGMMRYLDVLQAYPYAVVVYPNAGLPNAMGEYDETPSIMAAKVKPMIDRGMVNIIGGCCGTTPEHIAAIAAEASGRTPRAIPEVSAEMVLAGLEPLRVVAERNFMNVGERCNVAGSRKFLRLIKEKSIDEAIEIAREQVEAGAQVVDINMDDAMLESSREMADFVSRIGVEPAVARVPLMIDSSKWETIVSGLKCVQGRPIVNSISLKEGEEKFLEHARYIKEMGAAVIVMAFDEQGQADTYQRRIEVCERAYRLLTDAVGFNGCDIVFDPNVLAVATGIDAHNNYALDFIKAVEWIKANLPGAKVSGGVSNLSFSFRGNNYVREAMHAVFLYHAIEKGMDMGIVNAAAMVPVDDIPEELREAIDDVLLNRRDDATDRLVTLAERIKAERSGEKVQESVETETLSASQQIERMLVKGVYDGMEKYLDIALKELGSALAVIDGPLMAGMNHVGDLFGAGKLFLPQVVKSARTMKQAVTWLTPYIEEEKKNGSNSSAGRMVIATVKGDVHDIGKNICNVIMNCNGFDMIDMGVMVPGEEIVERAIAENADFIGLSGLITPSLEEMCNVAKLMEIKGMKIPLLIGGATTSAIHTAVKIAPCYGGPVVYTRDAASMPAVAQKLVNPATRDAIVAEVRAKQANLREKHTATVKLLSYDEAKARRPKLEYPCYQPVSPGVHDLTFEVDTLRDYINWRAFLSAWGLDASFASVMDIKGCDHCRAQWLASVPTDKVNKAAEAMQLLKEAQFALNAIGNIGGIHARVALLPAGSDGDTIVYESDNEQYRVPTLRQQTPSAKSGNCVALSDYICPIVENGELRDWIGLFAVTSGHAIEEKIADYKAKGDDYKVILYQTLADRLVEAATEVMHKQVRRELWGYAENEPENEGNRLLQYYKGIRPAIGYPSLPDQSLIFVLDKVLKYSDVGVTVTEHGAMAPAASTTGVIIAHPESSYFMVGAIDEKQRQDYASRRGMTLEELQKYLP